LLSGAPNTQDDGDEEIKLEIPLGVKIDKYHQEQEKKVRDLKKKFATFKEVWPKEKKMYFEAVRLRGGKAFGEQALMKNNEPMLRGATI
jgi:hypothetical protein